jgi:hypothetical protein
VIVTLVAPTKMESFNEGVTIYLVIISDGADMWALPFMVNEGLVTVSNGAERGGTGKQVPNVEGEMLSRTSFFVEEDDRQSQW